MNQKETLQQNPDFHSEQSPQCRGQLEGQVALLKQTVDAAETTGHPTGFLQAPEGTTRFPSLTTDRKRTSISRIFTEQCPALWLQDTCAPLGTGSTQQSWGTVCRPTGSPQPPLHTGAHPELIPHRSTHPGPEPQLPSQTHSGPSTGKPTPPGTSSATGKVWTEVVICAPREDCTGQG